MNPILPFQSTNVDSVPSADPQDVEANSGDTIPFQSQDPEESSDMKQIHAKQDELMSELDQLYDRIENVIQGYLTSRRSEHDAA